MATSEIRVLPFDGASINAWVTSDHRAQNWPVVYTLTGNRDVYVGETLNMHARAKQHLANQAKSNLDTAFVVIDDQFNKSACLDLESALIRWFSGDGATVRNLNAGVVDADYFDRATYQARFRAVFDELKEKGLFQRTIPEIENSDLFKLSPFKALTHEQAVAVDGLLAAFFADLRGEIGTTSVVHGAPGTGKTIVAIYLIKLLKDIAAGAPFDDRDKDLMFAEYFDDEHRALLQDVRIGLVIPQQSLRKSVQKVFAATPGLDRSMVLSPYDVGASTEPFDLLIADEAHRLNLRSNQPSAAQNKRFKEITEQLYGRDDITKTQLDWLTDRSRHRILMLDVGQSVRPSDLSREQTEQVVNEARAHERLHFLTSQMRLQDAAGFVQYVRDVLSGEPQRVEFDGYDLRFFEHFGDMHDAITAREQEHSLARLVAGYAWPWKTKKDKTAYDIEIDDCRLRWNQTAKDWINSATSAQEVGSIHTVQGYDLNYAGVIIGPELGYDAATGRVVFHRENYHDRKGMENNPTLNKRFGDQDLLEYVVNIYVVLMTRGMLGTYVYVVDPDLRDYLRPYFSTGGRAQPDIDVAYGPASVTVHDDAPHDLDAAQPRLDRIGD